MLSHYFSMTPWVFSVQAVADPMNPLAQTILDSLSAHVAILDEEGLIIETNLAWRSFAEANTTKDRPLPQIINYLDICDRARGDWAEESSSVADGIRKVMAGDIDEFAIDYPCHSPTEKRWFYMRVTRSAEPGPLRIVVSHENITALKLSEERLRASERALVLEKQKLEETNTALKVLLQEREEERRKLEQGVFDTMKQLVMPLVHRLKQLLADGPAYQVLLSLERRLEEITSPFLKQLSAVEALLTPQELEVASLIREGCSSKDIADILGVGLTTVHFHRSNLRQKLHLNKTGTNLRTYLLSLDK